jgi:predicted phage terminase large subunit-like protein
MVTAGIGGPITGRGGHLIVIDDPVKNWEEAASELIRQKHIDWFNSTLYTRAEPGASIVVLMTRWHEQDLAGYLLTEHQDDWQEIRLPALAEENDPLGRSIGDPLCPERYSSNALEQIRAAIGSRMFNALYQQRPAPQEGNLIKRSWFKFYRDVPTDLDTICLSADLSFKGNDNSDFVVLQIWGRKGANKYLLDQVRARMSFTETLVAIQGLLAKWPTTAARYVEDAANGAALIDTLRSKVSGLIPVRPQGSKIARAQAVTPQIEAGNVFLPDCKISNEWSHPISIG